MMTDTQTPAGEGNLHQTPVLTPTSARLCENELSPLARELRAALKTKEGSTPILPPATLQKQALILDALFTTLMLKGTATNGEDERINIAMALKTQQQTRETFLAMYELLGKHQT